MLTFAVSHMALKSLLMITKWPNSKSHLPNALIPHPEIQMPLLPSNKAFMTGGSRITGSLHQTPLAAVTQMRNLITLLPQ